MTSDENIQEVLEKKEAKDAKERAKELRKSLSHPKVSD